MYREGEQLVLRPQGHAWLSGSRGRGWRHNTKGGPAGS